MFQGGTIGARDSKHPDGPRLVLTPPFWTTFLTGAKDGSFDLSTSPLRPI